MAAELESPAPAGANRWRLTGPFGLGVAGGSAVLLCSLVNLLTYQSYPLLRPEVAIAAAALVGLAVIVSAAYAASSPLGRGALEALLAYLAVDLNWGAPLVGVAVAAGVLVFAYILRKSVLKVFAVGATATLASILAWPAAKPPPQGDSRAAAAPASDLPLLVHIIVDEHVGLEGLPEENPRSPAVKAALTDFYLSHGFRLYGSAFSTYAETLHSIPDILGAAKDPVWLGDRKGSTLGKTRYFDALLAQGYRLHVYQSNWIRYCEAYGIAACYRYRYDDHRPLLHTPISAVSKAALILANLATLSRLTQSVTPAYDEAAAQLRKLGAPVEPLALWHRAKVTSLNGLEAMDQLTRDLAAARPGEAYFAHVLLPHSPYIARPDCSIRSPRDWANTFAPADLRRRESAYFDQVACATTKVGQVLEAAERSPGGRRLVFIVHGDHGSRLTVQAVDAAHDNSRRDLIASYSTIFAVRAPGLAAGYDPTPQRLSRLVATLAETRFARAASGVEPPPVKVVLRPDVGAGVHARWAQLPAFWPKGAEAGNQVWTELSSPVTQRPNAATARAVNQKVTASAVR
jgi:hypothetical protein